MSAPLQTLATCGVPLLMTGAHALLAHGCPRDLADVDCECAIDAADEAGIGTDLSLNGWNAVYRTPFFAKFRLLSTGTPVIKVLFLDATTFAKLRGDSFDFVFEGVALRVPALIHVVAMRLQIIKNERDREAEDVPDILALLRANSGKWKPEELEGACRRFGPPGIYTRITRGLA